MKACIITNKGLEEYSSKEIKNLLNCETKISELIVFFDAEFNQILSLAYNGRTFQRVLILLNEFCFDRNPLEKFSFIKNELLKESFTIDGERFGEHDFNSKEIMFDLAGFIKKESGKKFDIKNGKTKFYFLIVNNHFVFGLDVSGFDLSKRDYRIFLGPEEIKPSIAFSLLMDAGYSSEKVLLDPFSKSGTICIEGALFALNKSPHFYAKNNFFLKNDFNDQINKDLPKIFCFDPEFKHVNASKKNAKIAGVNKFINFSRQNIDDLDLKFDKESIDCIVSQTPKFSKKKDESKVIESYKTFFRQAGLLLKKKGRLVILVNNLKAKDLSGLKLLKEQKIVTGSQESWILSYEK